MDLGTTLLSHCNDQQHPYAVLDRIVADLVGERGIPRARVVETDHNENQKQIEMLGDHLRITLQSSPQGDLEYDFVLNRDSSTKRNPIEYQISGRVRIDGQDVESSREVVRTAFRIGINGGPKSKKVYFIYRKK